MKNCEHIFNYMNAVESGSIEACEDQKLLMKYIRRCFDTENIITDEKLLEKYLGLVKYYPFEQLYPWEEFLIALAMCTFRDDGRPRWPDLFCLIGRGAGKDGFIAFSSMCFVSPYHSIPSYDVDICANNEEQATRPVKDLVSVLEVPEQITKLRRFFKWTKEQVTGLKNRGVVKGHTNNFKGKDGLRSGIVILNEIHQYENYDNINVFTTGLGKKPHPRRWYFTTNGDVREGPLDDILDRSERILRQGEEDNGLLPFICRIDAKEDVDDPANWQKANPSLPYKPDLMEETRKEYLEWKRNPAQLPAFMTKRMNCPESRHDVEITDYENIKATNRELPDLTGQSCVVGIDYASLRDFAAVDLHFQNGEDRYDICKAWINVRNPDLWRIKAPWKQWADPEAWDGDPPLVAVDDVEILPHYLMDYIAEMSEKYHIEKIALDKFRYALLKKPMEEMGFSYDEKNVKLIRPRDIMEVQPVISSCFLNHRFTWGNNPVLRWAANNTKLVAAGKKEGTDTGNFYYAKIEGKSRKTDPFMALVAAMAVETEAETMDYTDFGVLVG